MRSHQLMVVMHQYSAFSGAILSKALKIVIKGYQRFISPLLGPQCRFYPSCSNYALACLDKGSLLRAIFRIVVRILKCNPWHPGGEDLP